jgi:hypothetical protein
MKIGLALVSLVLATTTAYAQAPGDYDDGDLAPPGMAPVTVVAAPPPPVRQLRWSVGLNAGHLGVAPHMQPDNQSDFSIGQLVLRYRPWGHLEIELALGGGSEQLPDGTAGRQVDENVLALRYRFSPNRPWNWWLMAGMGSFAVTNSGASEDEKAAATQSTLQFGVGLERRWRHFALQVELRAVGVAPNDTEMSVATPPDPVTSTSTMPPKEPYSQTTLDGWKGGQTTIGASYYF